MHKYGVNANCTLSSTNTNQNTTTDAYWSVFFGRATNPAQLPIHCHASQLGTYSKPRNSTNNVIPADFGASMPSSRRSTVIGHAQVLSLCYLIHFVVLSFDDGQLPSLKFPDH